MGKPKHKKRSRSKSPGTASITSDHSDSSSRTVTPSNAATLSSGLGHQSQQGQGSHQGQGSTTQAAARHIQIPGSTSASAAAYSAVAAAGHSRNGSSKDILAATSLPRSLKSGGSFKQQEQLEQRVAEYAKIRSTSRSTTPQLEQAAARLVEEHLVRRGDGPNADLIDQSPLPSQVTHSLQGGSITSEIYQWADRHRDTPSPTPSSRTQRRLSNPELQSTALMASPDVVTASSLLEPGALRRRFLAERAERAGKPPVTFLTRNFIDFLALYGFYGGDVVPDAEDDSDGLLDASGGDTDDSCGDIEEGSSSTFASPQRGVESQTERARRLQEINTIDFGSAQPDNNSLTRRRQDGPSVAFGDLSQSFHSTASEQTPLLRRSASQRSGTGSGRVPEATNVKGTSAKKAFFMLMKSFVGTGVLFLPKAFSQGGMAFSIILMGIFGWMTLHCMLLLLETSQVLGGSFGDIGEKLYGPPMRILVLASIAISQAGFACAYYIFVAQNLRDLLMLTSNCTLILPDWIFILLQITIYVPLSWVRKIKTFSITSLIADVFILLGLSYIFVYDVSVLATTGPAHDIIWFNLESFPIFIGTALFAFEGICLILPIAESMKNPQEFPKVLTLCITVIGAIFVVIGASGYLTFGSKVETVIFLNMPKGSPLVLTLQAFYAVAIILSFPLCVYPSIRITESAVFGLADGKSSVYVKWQKNLMRTVFVAMLAVVAWTGSSNLDKFVSLVGCFACIPLSFIYPAIFHYHITTKPWVKAKDIGLVVFGFVALVYTTYITVIQWVGGSPDIPVDRCAARGMTGM
ncbi:neutral amino acid transporter [Rhizoclosmatium sp. JEL0117]|nr:neutral amino acid transporter [Rhizoclosmatium sp. JEL0117]